MGFALDNTCTMKIRQHRYHSDVNVFVHKQGPQVPQILFVHCAPLPHPRDEVIDTAQAEVEPFFWPWGFRMVGNPILAGLPQCSPCFAKRFFRLILARRPANRALTRSVRAAWLSVSATPQRGSVIWWRVAGSSTPLMGSWDTHWNSLSGGIEIKDHKGRVGGESGELPWIQQEAGAGGSGGLRGGTMEHGPLDTHGGSLPPGGRR